MPTGPSTLPGWGEMLLGEARLSLIGTPWSPLLAEPVHAELLPPFESFRDEAGHARPIDPLLIAWLSRSGLRKQSSPLTSTSSLDLRLWQLLLQHAAGAPSQMLDAVNPALGRLVHNPDTYTLEVWTEVELSALHALSHAGPAAKSRRDSATDWIVENLQPDNATNHPWSVHVFLRRAFENDMPEHRLYAESLLHNCIVSLGRPDRFSALVLLDAGRALLSAA